VSISPPQRRVDTTVLARLSLRPYRQEAGGDAPRPGLTGPSHPRAAGESGRAFWLQMVNDQRTPIWEFWVRRRIRYFARSGRPHPKPDLLVMRRLADRALGPANHAGRTEK